MGGEEGGANTVQFRYLIEHAWDIYGLKVELLRTRGCHRRALLIACAHCGLLALCSRQTCGDEVGS